MRYQTKLSGRTVLLGSVLVLLMAGGPAGATLTSAEVTSQVNAALSGPPSNLEAAILGIVQSVPAEDAGQVAADILAAADNASVAQGTAIGKALATHVAALKGEGQLKAAHAVVGAMESAKGQGNRAALAAYEQTEGLTSVSVPTGPVGAGLNTQFTSQE